MALQGTIETFALPDVLRLLASTGKTGCLRLDGARGTGRVWVEDGRVVASEASTAPRAEGLADAVFELLRSTEGAFVFDVDVAPDSPEDGEEVETVLDQAKALLDEWHVVEAVVPSLDIRVSLASELPGDDVVLDRSRWRVISLIGGGCTVRDLGDALRLDELPVSRQVKDLVEQGLVVLGDPVPETSDPADPFSQTDVSLPADPFPQADVSPRAEGPSHGEPIALVPDLAGDDEPRAHLSLAPERTEEISFVDEAQFAPFDPDVLAGASDGRPDGSGRVDAVGASRLDALVAPEPNEAAEIARQLANLSPKAAKAVAAAARATTEDERVRALADVDDGEDPINRELLIKFLGSVNG